MSFLHRWGVFPLTDQSQLPSLVSPLTDTAQRAANAQHATNANRCVKRLLVTCICRVWRCLIAALRMTAWCTELQSQPICVHSNPPPPIGVNDRHRRRPTGRPNPKSFRFLYIHKPRNAIFCSHQSVCDVLFRYTTFCDSSIINLEYLNDSKESLSVLQLLVRFSWYKWFHQSFWSTA